MAKINIEYNTEDMTLAEIFLIAEKFVGAYVERVESISANQSVIDKELSKISHEMETSKEDVVGAWYLYKRFRELRRVRRVIKNDFNFSKSINSEKINMQQVRQSLQKGVSNYRASQSYRDGQQVYLNQEALGTVNWKDVEATANSCLPKIDEDSLGALKEKLNSSNA